MKKTDTAGPVYYDIKDHYLAEQRFTTITEGLRKRYHNLFFKMLRENAIPIADFITNMNTEINLSLNHKVSFIEVLSALSHFNGNKKAFREMNRENILSFLDSVRKPEITDPQHKWVGTYNLYRVLIVKFFKWLYYPDMHPAKRQKPSFVENIPKLKRKERSIYKPSDLWTGEHDLLFLKYCPSKRMKCYHAVSRDLSCRPHELLRLKIKDVFFKSTGGYQYAEVLLNGKTGSRSIPLINSIPYLKDYLDNEHPQPSNPNAPLNGDGGDTGGDGDGGDTGGDILFG
jgi:integrase